LYEDADIFTLIRERRLNLIGHMNWMADFRRAKKTFNSQLEGVRTRGRPRYEWWECVLTNIKRG
jgi:hypothetical protein